MPNQYTLDCLGSDDEVTLVPGYFEGKPALAILIYDHANNRDLGPFLINRHFLGDELMEMATLGVYENLSADKDYCEICSKAVVKCSNERCSQCHKEYCTQGGGLGDDYYHERLWPKA